MPVGATAWISALLFGFLLGWSVTRDRESAVIGIRATAALCVIGVTAWLFGPGPGSDHAMAAVGMTFAGATATTVALVVHRMKA